MSMRVAAVLSDEHGRPMRAKRIGTMAWTPAANRRLWHPAEGRCSPHCPRRHGLLSRWESRFPEEVRRRLVQANRHHPRLVVEDRLDAVTVMHINIDVADPLAAVVQQPTNGNGYVVVDTEAAGRSWHGVMQSAADVAAALRVTGPHPWAASTLAIATEAAISCIPGKTGLSLVQAILLIRFAAPHGRDVVRGMDGFEQCKINIGRWHDP